MTKGAVSFTPQLRAEDDYANYWIRQIVLRLRREICWCWHERGQLLSTEPCRLPPFSDKISSILDLSKFADEKTAFFSSDPTARYITDQIAVPAPSCPVSQQGSFGWVVDKLGLKDIASCALALGLTNAFDNAAGTIMACCMNDPSKTYPSLALLQNLWKEPAEVLSLADPMHSLFSYGLLLCTSFQASDFQHIDWDAPISVPLLVARQLLFPESDLPASLVTLNDSRKPLQSESVSTSVHLFCQPNCERLAVIPVRGPHGCRRLSTICKAADSLERTVVQFSGDPANLQNIAFTNSLLTLCWLRNVDLYLDEDAVKALSQISGTRGPSLLQSIPINLFIAISGREIPGIFSRYIQPTIEVPGLTYSERVMYWEKFLNAKPDLKNAICECARSFRFEIETINAIANRLKLLTGPITEKNLKEACWAVIDLDLGELAQKVIPRFTNEKLFLPSAQSKQFMEVEKAMRTLTEVHYKWGTARAWNESGISVLFAGPPGSGKTMAAEMLAIKLGLPMYRIDLSQVVNKYIGETEKNLKRLFDAADISDSILFFDEADSLFGRRTEVKDAHDRYANLEISYLLERMERFKGMAILATNRKKDLDDAFLRRLRVVIDFPFPDLEERYKIWQQVIPKAANDDSLDIDFLASQFPLAGGHIRSIVFNACLQSAGRQAGNEQEVGLKMESIVMAVKREYDKLNLPISLEQFGPYAGLVREMEL